MSTSLKETLLAALDQLGADTSSYQLDDRSSIALSFDDVGDIFFDPQPNERVWLWGLLDDMDKNARDALAAPLLSELVRPVRHWESGALVLRQDGRVGGLLHPDVIADAAQLSAALKDFHETLGRLKSLR
ncbi:hypothetical protein OHS33_36570 [Streptomyces sp. NBC_00536]|uniref:InvB/SpaK family type III secretion system chaperone n=1 Tax=Streptomyces sp. NBC_00536 TaxID=2975769 RepID=UPI002E800D10|nr:hypothetical protein [Streptomyces sp. NBC_00536]WUC83399.1 hypothetical protein OHS33_36570 [Streptomyces sp. NBC_00536]